MPTTSASRPSNPSLAWAACRCSSSSCAPGRRCRWARSRRPWSSPGRPCPITWMCSGAPGWWRVARKSGTSTIPCSGRRSRRSVVCSPPAARRERHERQGPHAHARIRPRQEPRVLREVPGRGSGQGQDGLCQVPARLGAREPRPLAWRRGRPRHRGPRRHPGRVGGDGHGPARPREGGRATRHRGDGRQLLSRQPGQVLGHGSRRRGVGGLSPQLRSRGRDPGARGQGAQGTAAREEYVLLQLLITTQRGDAMAEQDIKSIVKDKYAKAALRVTSSSDACCGSASSRGECDPITSNIYTESETCSLPAEATAASLGCGNPTALAELKPGETVLDLGSGGGIDVLLSARRVGPTGTAYGLDMTDEMLALARENQRKAGMTNVEFLKGEIEHIPLPAESVDVIISNCVINLSADKDAVLAEAFRVLKPGGRFAVSDVVVRGEVPSDIRRSVELWIGCVAGALEDVEYRAKLAKAGFEDIDLEPTRIYTAESARDFLSGAGLGAEAIAAVDGKFISAFVRARKPLS